MGTHSSADISPVQCSVPGLTIKQTKQSGKEGLQMSKMRKKA